MTVGQRNHSLQDLSVDHVKFYVTEIEDKIAELVDGYGFEVYSTCGTRGGPSATYSVALGAGGIRLVLSEAQQEDHPGAAYTNAHGDCVADIALTTSDAAGAFTQALRHGARPVSHPAERVGFVTASIVGFGDVVHTFVQRLRHPDPRALPGFVAAEQTRPRPGHGLSALDHFAVCLEAGQLDATVEFYEQALDFRQIYAERIVVGAQAMNSKVVQSSSGNVTLTLIEPDLTRDPGQIDEFVKNHGGAGVQHIAFVTTDIADSVSALGARGVRFLDTPSTYYSLLAERLELARHSVDRLQDLNILVDEDHDGQLYQIFAKSTHPRRTFFFEVIERAGARTFGSGNIKALYEAVELQRARDHAPA